MKYIALIMCLVFAGCATLYPPELPEQNPCTVAVEPVPVLCKVFAYLQITPAQANDMLLDASLVGIWSKVTKAPEIQAAIDKVEMFLNNNEVGLNGLIKYVVKEAEIDPALALLLSRRLSRFQNIPELGDLVLDTTSRAMVFDHLQNQKEQLSWF